MKPGYYSPHFSHVEMASSEMAARRGIDNRPPEAVQKNLERLCGDYLERLRSRFGAIRVSSGYRCPALNAAIGGSAVSAHMDGRAADLQFLDPAASLLEVMDWVVTSAMDFDQVIFEFGSWIHLGIAKAGADPRRDALMIFGGTGYLEFSRSDPRIKAAIA